MNSDDVEEFSSKVIELLENVTDPIIGLVNTDGDESNPLDGDLETLYLIRMQLNEAAQLAESVYQLVKARSEFEKLLDKARPMFAETR